MSNASADAPLSDLIAMLFLSPDAILLMDGVLANGLPPFVNHSMTEPKGMTIPANRLVFCRGAAGVCGLSQGNVTLLKTLRDEAKKPGHHGDIHGGRRQ